MPYTRQTDRLSEHLNDLAQSYGPITEVNGLLGQANTGLGVVMRLARAGYRTRPAFRLLGVCPDCGREAWSQSFEDEVGLLSQHNVFTPSQIHKQICPKQGEEHSDES